MNISRMLLLTLISFGTSSTFAGEPKPNPFLAAENLAITHIDSAQTDSYPYTIPKGTFHIDLDKTPEVSGGPVNIITLISADSNYMWGVSSGGVTYIDRSNGGWKEVARATVPGIKPVDAALNKEALGKPFKSEQDVINVVKNVYQMTGLERIANGVYSLVDKNNLVYASYGKTVYVFGLVDENNPASGISILRSLDFTTVNPNDSIAGLSITYDGQLIILGHNSLCILDRNLKDNINHIKFDANEEVSNSLAVDENNGIYVASNKKMHKIVWTGSKISQDENDGAWTSAYDTGDQPPVIKYGTGTGSTPTLVGFGDDPDKLVVITDGSNRMKLVAFWRDAIPEHFKQISGTKSKRIAGQIPVTCGFKKLPKFIQSEQSVVSKNYGAFVVNNIGTKGNKDLLIGVMALGPVYPPPHGLERFEWDPKEHKWHSVWTNNDEVSTSMVPVVSVPSNIVLVNGYSKERGWEVTGLDWESGEVVHRTIFGHTNYGNGAYAILEIYPDNNLIFNSIAGPFRIQYN